MCENTYFTFCVFHVAVQPLPPHMPGACSGASCGGPSMRRPALRSAVVAAWSKRWRRKPLRRQAAKMPSREMPKSGNARRDLKIIEVCTWTSFSSTHQHKQTQANTSKSNTMLYRLTLPNGVHVVVCQVFLSVCFEGRYMKCDLSGPPFGFSAAVSRVESLRVLDPSPFELACII